MASPFPSLTSMDVLNAFRRMRTSVKIKSDFSAQVDQIDKFLDSDNTGLVSTLVDFMTHTATVPMKIEVGNDGLNENLKKWQTELLNKNFNIDISRGLRDLSYQYFKERYRSSLIGLKVQWGEESFGEKTLIVPQKMWILDGKNISIKSNDSLNKRIYQINMGQGKMETLLNTEDESIYIRRPYEAWNKKKTTPFLIKRGVLYNGLFKKALLEKQADTIESIIFYLFLMRAGNDKLAEMDLLPTKEELQALEEQVIKAKEGDLTTEGLKSYIAKLRYDVNFEHLVPELERVINEEIIKPIDKNILSGLGLIELQGFGTTRQETMLNPKIMVEEVVDAVFDWADLLSNVMMDMMDKNKENHRNLANNKVEVIPGVIKAFITDEMKTIFRSLYDRGLLSKETSIDSMGEMINHEVEIQRRRREDNVPDSETNLQKIMKPPITQNLEQFDEPQNLEDENKAPNTPEVDNFNQAQVNAHLESRKDKKKKRKTYKTSYTVDNLPEEIKSKMTLSGKIVFTKALNIALEEHVEYDTAIDFAFDALENAGYKRQSDGKYKKV